MHKTITKLSIITYVFVCFSISSFTQPVIEEWEKHLTGVLQEPSGSGSIQVSDIVSDEFENSYLTGRFIGTIDFDPDPNKQSLLISAGPGGDIFILKLDSAGSLVWVKQIGSKESTILKINLGRCIAIDQSGDLLVGGQFSDTVDFDPGSGTSILNASPGIFGMAPFICKFDTAGNFIWAKSFTGTPTNQLIGSLGYVIDISFDYYGNIYTAGNIDNASSFDFDPDGRSYPLFIDVGKKGIFYSKLDNSGNFIWAKLLNVPTYSTLTSFSLDTFANIYATGSFVGTVDFDPNSGNYPLTSKDPNKKSPDDIFILKLDSAGSFIWAKQIGANGHQNTATSTRIISDKNGNSYLSGYFKGSMDFDPSASSTSSTLTSQGEDIFVLKLDSFGTFSWVKQIGGLGNDRAVCITRDRLNNIYVAGSYMQSVDFDPAQGNNSSKLITSKSDVGEGYVFKLNSIGDFIWVVGLNNLVAELDVNKNEKIFAARPSNNNIGVTNISHVNKFNQHECNVTYSSLIEESCYSFSLNDEFYTSSGTYYQTLTNIKECDSILTLNLTIHDATVNNIVDTACKFYILNNQKYTTSGNYTQTFTNSYGCDSVLMIDLTIETIDVSVTKNENELSANIINATYQWVDCNNNFEIIPGANERDFTPSSDGSYAVVITSNNCTDTSACFLIDNPSFITANTNDYHLNLYPNPSSGRITLKTSIPIKNGSIKITNLVGQVIQLNIGLRGNAFEFDLSGISSGLYFMELSDAKQKQIIKLIKE